MERNEQRTFKVLYVDNNLGFNLLMRSHLQKIEEYSFILEHMPCSEEAIRRCYTDRPDFLIVCNAGGSLGVGLMLAKQMLEDAYVRTIPLVVYSTWYSEEDINYAMGLGASGYITMPANQEKLEETIRRVVEEKLIKQPERKELAKPTHELYQKIISNIAEHNPYKLTNLGEDMQLVYQHVVTSWHPRFLLDHRAQTSLDLMGPFGELHTVTPEDVLWPTLYGLSAEGKRRAVNLNARFLTTIDPFKDGVAMMAWKVNIDGMYYMDSDGYGMTDDEEETLHGFIDRQGRVVSKFRKINDDSELEAMRQEAIANKLQGV